MSLGGRRWPVAAAVVAGGLFALLLPLPVGEQSRVAHALAGSCHVILFAVLAGVLRAVAPARISGWLIWLGLAVGAGAIECIQPFIGRSAEWAEWFYGVAGAACFSFRRPWPAGGSCGRWVMVMLGLLILFPLGWEFSMWRGEDRAFPVLAQPGTFWAGRGWTLHGVKLSVTAEGNFRVTSKTTKNQEGFAYPGLFRGAVVSDWSEGGAFQTAIYWPGSESAVFAVRMDDLPGNPPYAERFQREFAVTQGWNHVKIPAAQWGTASGGRAMNVEAIRQWGLFLVSATEGFDYFLFAPVRLVAPASGAAGGD